MSRRGSVVPDHELELESIPPADVNREVLSYLSHGERVYVQTPMHPLVLWRQALAVILATALLVTTIQRGDGSDGSLNILLLLWFGSLAWLGWSEFGRRKGFFVVTDKRVLKVTGIFSKDVPMMRHVKVTDLRFRRPWWGRPWDLGSIVFETAGQDQALREVSFVPHAQETYHLIVRAILGEKPLMIPKPPPSRRVVLWLRDHLWPRDDGPDDFGGPSSGGGGTPRPPTPPYAGGSGSSPASPIEPHPTRRRRSDQGETLYSSSPGANHIGDTGEIPVVRAEDVPLYPPTEWTRGR